MKAWKFRMTRIADIEVEAETRAEAEKLAEEEAVEICEAGNYDKEVFELVK